MVVLNELNNLCMQVKDENQKVMISPGYEIVTWAFPYTVHPLCVISCYS